MKEPAAYAMCVLGGKASPTAADVKAVIEAAGGTADEEQLTALCAAMEGKSFAEMCAAGMEKIKDAAAADLEWNTVVRDVAELRNGWTPPPQESPAHLPFAVRRTASGFLPVYPKVGANRPPATVLRGASGDLDALIAGLAGVAPGAEVTKRLGALEVRGDHVRGVRRWLAGLGL